MYGLAIKWRIDISVTTVTNGQKMRDFQKAKNFFGVIWKKFNFQNLLERNFKVSGLGHFQNFCKNIF
jgi:hypothetical protein